MNITIKTNAARLGKAIGLYATASGKTIEEAVAKQFDKVSYALYHELRGLMPAKGAVRADRLAALKAGQGVHVRQSIRDAVARKYGLDASGLMHTKAGRTRRSILVGGKRLNAQALAVRGELNLRESGRGFTAYAAKFSSGKGGAAGVGRSGFTFGRSATAIQIISRYSQILAEAGFYNAKGDTGFQLKWSGVSAQSSAAAQSLLQPRGQRAIASALEAVTSDIMPYLQRKLGNNALAAFKYA